MALLLDTKTQLTSRDRHAPDFDEGETTLVDPQPAWKSEPRRSRLAAARSQGELERDTLDDPFQLAPPLPEAPTVLAAPGNDPDTNPAVTAVPLSRRSAWVHDAKQARQSLAWRRDQREALARVIAMAKPRTSMPRTHIPRPRRGTGT